MEIISKSGIMCVNFTIKGEEVCKYSWQFFFTVEIFENETQKLKVVQFGYWECIVNWNQLHNLLFRIMVYTLL